MENPVMIIGAGGLGKAALDIFQSNGILVYGLLDYDKKLHGAEINDVVVMGDPEDDGFLKYIGKKCEAFVALENNQERKAIVDLLKTRRKVMPINAIHPSAFISSTAQISQGSFINAGVSVGAFAKIGNHCIIHSKATIEHQAQLSDYIQVGAGSIINSGVVIGEGSFIGSGVTVVSGVKIGKNASVGAGSVVIENVKNGQTVFGNPAKSV
ncbi:MAG: acetyltransferase [Bacteroidetes bacterium]|nr:acetyltransferase [Bacteroidota bacterium]